MVRQCDDVLDLVRLAECRLVSTRFDTHVSRPTRPIPHSLRSRNN